MSTRKKVPFNNPKEKGLEKVNNPRKEEEEPSAPSPPQLTFTEEEVQKVANFVNFLHKNARFDRVGAKDASVINNYFDYMHAHINKLESHIFEFKRVMKSRKED